MGEVIPLAMPIPSDEKLPSGTGHGAGAGMVNVSNESDMGSADIENEFTELQNEHHDLTTKSVLDKALESVHNKDISRLKTCVIGKIQRQNDKLVVKFENQTAKQNGSLYAIEAENKMIDLIIHYFSDWCIAINSLDENSDDNLRIDKIDSDQNGKQLC